MPGEMLRHIEIVFTHKPEPENLAQVLNPALDSVFKPPSFLKETVVIAQSAEVLPVPVITSEVKKTLLPIIHGSVLDQARNIVRRGAFKTKLALVHSSINKSENSFNTMDYLSETTNIKGSKRLQYKRRGRRPRGRCPDCGKVYILMLGHSNCTGKKEEPRILSKVT